MPWSTADGARATVSGFAPGSREFLELAEAHSSKETVPV
jgi:hypothetical protein